ncbi:MAG TPA: hypothetical protein VIU61_20360 [Kofleriaceae bacterium]
MRRVLIALTAITLAGACKGDAKKCEEAARNYATLMYWKTADAEIAALPESQRALARHKKLSAFTNGLEAGIDARIQQCVSANNEEQIECMIKAKTAEEVSKCAEPAPEK